jgi:hypothetical protein
MSTLTVEFRGTIRRPRKAVMRQFCDIRHHTDANVHPDLRFTLLSDDNRCIRYRQEVTVLGMRQRDEIVACATGNGTITADVVSGSNRGTHITQTFHEDEPGMTSIVFRMEIPITGFKRLLKPAFAVAVRNTLARAFEEDRIDLEERGYAI